MKQKLWYTVRKAVYILIVFFICAALLYIVPNIMSKLAKAHRERTKYIPEKEWTGLETREYSMYDHLLVSAYETGNPDPIFETPVDPDFDLTQIHLQKDQERYSLCTDPGISVVMTNGTAEDVAVGERINLERWNGSSWDRMIITYHYMVPASDTGTLPAGESREYTLRFADSITVLTPGKYRAVAYVNGEAVYAEFELTE